MKDFVCVGEIVKAIGLKGELKLYPLLDYFDGLLDSPYTVWQDGSPVKILRHRPARSCVALMVEGVQSREAAEAMLGRELGFMRGSYVRDDFPVPPGGLAFRYLGRRVVTRGGDEIGRVDEVRLMGGAHMLVVPDGKREILIPAVEPILVRDDRSLEGDLVIDPPEGLLDVEGLQDVQAD
ncbi:16S rRNA processing protein RimM [bacterium DOLJORAL78_65_58]|nr:MAG: 16S rRNA processing protein RimM [bacterium DOLZORAL124_64_63]PIE75431.1 MAG: 16S rRNA processing protein RimM [bacterium DOLJORAL78_65_58]